MSGHDHHHDGHGHHDHDLAHHHPGDDAICLQDVSYTYPTGRAALRNITLHVPAGSRLGIIGPNGAGKTTLLKVMLGLLEGYTGSVQVMGMPPRRACARGDVIGYVPQRIDVEWRFPLSAMQVVMMGLTGKVGLFRRPSRADREHVQAIMQRVGVADLARRPIGELSGGQQQRLFIARALAPRPRILVLDEPTVGVDEAGQQQFAALLDELCRTMRLTLVVVSHDLRAIAAGCSEVACLNQTLHYHASPTGLTAEVLREVFSHEVAPVLGDA